MLNGVSAFVGIILVGSIAFLLPFLSAALVQIDEGFLGVYYIGGALQDYVSGPGYHFMVPYLTDMVPIQTTIQTDEVKNVPCGTSGGVMVYFDKVEVVNRLKPEAVLETVRNYGVNYDHTLIYDKVHHEINQFCSSHTLQEIYIDQFDQIDENLIEALQAGCNRWVPGLDVISVRVTKPRIPDNIKKQYELMEEEKTKLLVAEQTKRLVEKEAETERRRAIIAAQKEAEISRINFEMQIAERESIKTMQQIEDEAELARQRAKADAEYYAAELEARGNAMKLTAEYLELMKYKSLASNAKLFFGSNLPEYFGNLSLGPIPSTSNMTDVSGPNNPV
eukprot:Clim_evm2s55 gene=Clim_evmTU2s55